MWWFEGACYSGMIDVDRVLGWFQGVEVMSMKQEDHQDDSSPRSANSEMESAYHDKLYDGKFSDDDGLGVFTQKEKLKAEAAARRGVSTAGGGVHDVKIFTKLWLAAVGVLPKRYRANRSIAQYSVKSSWQSGRGRVASVGAILAVIVLTLGVTVPLFFRDGGQGDAHDDVGASPNPPSVEGAFTDEDYEKIDPQSVHDPSGDAEGGSKDSWDYPAPPDPKKDLLEPAHVLGSQKIVIDQRRSVVVGDSTVAYGDGVKTRDDGFGCRVEKGTWAGFLGVRNYGCAGIASGRLLQKISEKKKLFDGVDTVFITVGSNDVRRGEDTSMEGNMGKIVMKLREFNPQMNIVFVGYLPSFVDGKCMGDRERKASSRLNFFHKMADMGMKNAALREGAHFVDLSQLKYEVCSKGSFIRLPGSGAGASWHTSVAGHEYVADAVRKFAG